MREPLSERDERSEPTNPVMELRIQVLQITLHLLYLRRLLRYDRPGELFDFGALGLL
jgi:hypothetical protein